VLALFLFFNLLTLTRRVGGAGLSSVHRVLGGEPHTRPRASQDTHFVRSPVSRPAEIATGGLSKGGRGYKSHEGRNQHSIEVGHMGVPQNDRTEMVAVIAPLSNLEIGKRR
jgi:hypothetical protein